MSVAGQAARTTSMRAAVEVAAARGRDGSSAASASVVARDLLIENIRKNVMAWTKWNVLDESTLKLNQPLRVLQNAKRG